MNNISTGITIIKHNDYLSHSDFERKVDHYSKELEAKGISTNSTVVIQIENGLDFCVTLFSLWKMQCTVTPISPLAQLDLLPNEFKYSAVIRKGDIKILDVGCDAINDVALVLTTSGTTGKSKLIPITFEQLENKYQAYDKFFRNKDFKNYLCLLPLTFGHGLISCFLYPLSRKKNVYIGTSDLESLIDIGNIIDTNEIDFLSLTPGGYKTIVNLGTSPSGRTLKTVHCASAPLERELIKRIETFFKINSMFNMYGMTELCSWLCGGEIKSSTYTEGFIGKPIDCEIKIEDGNILAKANYMLQGYLFNNELNLKTLKDGWFFTGDRGKFDSDGNLILNGRSDSLINIDGNKFYPSEIDNIVKTLKDVTDVHTFSTAKNGVIKIVCAIVAPSNFLTQPVRDKIMQKLERYKVPHYIIRLEKTPLTERGKLDKNEILKGII